LAEPSLSRNPISLAGAFLTTLGAVGFLAFLVLDAFGLLHSPYAGLLGYLLAPAIFVLGLLLIPLGMWREGRRRRRGKTAWHWPVLNLEKRRTRVVIGAIVMLTLVNLGIVAVASVGVVHYTESNRFCGQVCHTPMTPEFTAHQFSAHSKVDCVSCHVAPGPSGMLTAKMNGTRQLYLLATGKYSRPIPEPVGRIPKAVETCANCHTPGRPQQDLTRALVSYGDDEKSTESVTALTMLMAANHWHARQDVSVEFVASDEKAQTIPFVRVTAPGGQVTEYFADGVSAAPAGAVVRMDCLDCHNRPAHTFSASAERGVDALIRGGGVSHDIPFVRKQLVAAVSKPYASHEAADAGIAAELNGSFRGLDAKLRPEADRAVAAAQALYRRSVFPAMKVTWGTYLSNLGHTDAPGCFRCHDGGHKAKDGTLIRQDCDLCHRIQ
jgi:hypothetical protein